jgi:hypothetical protein
LHGFSWPGIPDGFEAAVGDAGATLVVGVEDHHGLFSTAVAQSGAVLSIDDAAAASGAVVDERAEDRWQFFPIDQVATDGVAPLLVRSPPAGPLITQVEQGILAGVVEQTGGVADVPLERRVVQLRPQWMAVVPLARNVVQRDVEFWVRRFQRLSEAGCGRCEQTERDRERRAHLGELCPAAIPDQNRPLSPAVMVVPLIIAVSYTHLTLPTKLL